MLFRPYLWLSNGSFRYTVEAIVFEPDVTLLDPGHSLGTPELDASSIDFSSFLFSRKARAPWRRSRADLKLVLLGAGLCGRLKL
jgi:hypothetical protein